MNTTPKDLKLSCIIAQLIALSLFAFLFISCDIEESEIEEATSGSILVTTQTPEGGEIIGASVSLDGVVYYGLTPVTLTDVETGQHEVTVTKLGYSESSLTVNVVANEITPAVIEMPINWGSEIGNMAIDFTLPNLDSTLYNLSDYDGKVVLLSFYTNNCAPCLIEFPHIQDVWENPDFADQIQFFGINGQDVWTIFQLYPIQQPQLGLTFPLLHDATQEVRRDDYNVCAHPANFLIDQNGVIRYRWGSITEELLVSSIQTLLDEAE